MKIWDVIGTIMIVSVIAVTVVFLVGVHRIEVRVAKEQEQKKQDCKKLNPTYLGAYTIKTGFYRNALMTPVNVSETQVAMVASYGADDTVRWFDCNNVKLIEQE